MTEPAPLPPTLVEATGTWTRVAALSFGGPAGQIAVMHRILVEEKKWISEERFLHALNFCMLLPGPEAQQLATYIGWLMHGVRGGLIAGTLFIIPGAISILVLSWIYAAHHQSPAIQALFYGLKPAVLAIVFEAVLRIGKRVLKNRLMNGVAGLSFVAIFFFAVQFPIIVVAAGLIGYCGGRIAPKQFLILKGHDSTTGTEDIHELHMAPVAPSWGRTLRVSFICLSLWFGPLLALYYWLGPDSIYLRQGLFFSQAAVVTFGGAYSVLAYVAQQAVERFQWLKPTEMLNGLGMAETTPGPLIMVVQYVAFMGAYRDPGPLSPLMAGVLGSAITTWVTFVPCFYWIFLGAPYIERMRGQKLLTAALSTITAAVVGVVLNLAVWFAVHTVFTDVSTVTYGWLHLECPRWGSLDLAASGIAVLAMILTFRMKVTMPITLLISAAVGTIGYLLKQQISISE